MEETTGRIVIGQDDRNHLTRAAKWAKFISIVVFIVFGLYLVFAIFGLLAGGVAKAHLASAGWTSGMWTAYMVVLLMLMAIGFFINLLLYRFATKTLQAVKEGNDAVMTEAFANLGQYFRLSGIVLIVTLALSLLAVIIMVAAGASMMR